MQSLVNTDSVIERIKMAIRLFDEQRWRPMDPMQVDAMNKPALRSGSPGHSDAAQIIRKKA
jgi:hypothetical protein